MNTPSNHRNESMAAAMGRTRRMWMRNLVITAALIVALFAFNAARSGGMKLEFGPDALSVSVPGETPTSIAYRDMQHIRLYTAPDYGTCVRGSQEAACWHGTWRNDLWGTYALCVHPKVQSCVVIETMDGMFAVNGATDRETASIKDALDSVLAGPANP